jgi:MFS family permease
VAPTVFAAVLVAGLVESSIMSLMAVYGLRLGLPQAEAVLLVTVTIAGTVFLQVPIGRLADRMNRRLLLVATALIGLAGALVMQWFLEPAYVRWPFLFLWGGLFMGLYTIGLAELGDRFSGGALSGANALYVMTYCIGSMAGPPIAGAVMDWRGPASFPAVLSVFFATGLTVAAWRALMRRARRRSGALPSAGHLGQTGADDQHGSGHLAQTERLTGEHGGRHQGEHHLHHQQDRDLAGVQAARAVDGEKDSGQQPQQSQRRRPRP